MKTPLIVHRTDTARLLAEPPIDCAYGLRSDLSSVRLRYASTVRTRVLRGVRVVPRHAYPLAHVRPGCLPNLGYRALALSRPPR